ncbi:MAG: WG repeat-containing protein, partial [Clostridia bacterium]|nr:WG repeat-containing protein [Clostridia bacterium]
MKRFFAACLALIMLLSAGELACASEISEIIKLDCEPVRYLVYYRDPFISNHWSLVDADGGMIKEFFADSIYGTDDGRYVVRRSGLYGLMDASGKFIAEPRYQNVGSFSEGLAPVKYEGFYGYVNGDFELVIPPAFDRADRFYNGLACVGVNGLYGYIDVNGEYVFEPQFDYSVGFYNSKDVIHVTKGNSDLLINRDGTVELEADHSIDNYYKTETGYDIVTYEKTEDGKLYGLLLSDGCAIEPRFMKVGYSDEFPLIAVKQDVSQGDPWASDSLWGFINRAGEYVVEPTFHDLRFLEGGLALVSVGDLYGILDKNGEWLVEPRFDGYGFGWPMLVKQDGLYGMLNADGSYMIEPAFERLYGFYDGYAEAEQDGLCGLVDESGSWVLPAEYAVIGDRNAHCAVVSMDEDAAWWDVYDRAPGAGLVSLPEGKLLLEMGYDDISIANDDGTVSAEKDGV